ncbi:MAG: ABC transporter ATP-binding protein [Candidatus Niyogibacteria bacterium CG10_big_fil_rev_8_21_14_0_10_46_36]|uniref:ABC transporter ATP-binding protein n=1 Tax=Candidatus Niyogibacteria bacterium CG10_big_fil_rev_8_21_14_0_10_46_36 TaxID=1974726 RepID=A0A2H0TDU9_9BACT|nr:MAG: ABC transporter ATP-binding protein [Candidatus Niyogibacteria bacterium CG10_big_fil_rev_8_21_14_0_10_46_36]
MTQDALSINHLRKGYGKTLAVDDVSFSIKEGEFFGFLGPNGAGKTTTIQCITGVSNFSEGDIAVFGFDVKKQYRDARLQIGLSPQEFTIDLFMKVKDVFDYMAGYYGMRGDERKKRVTHIIHTFELQEHAEKQFRMLSGGLKRRVMMGRALVHDPKLIILDEPTAGVDVELRHDIWRYLRDLNRAGKTILLTSHYLEEVEKLCSRIGIIYGGKMVALGDKEDFLDGGKTLEEKYFEITGNHAK